jgi:hypothetical protein
MKIAGYANPWGVVATIQGRALCIARNAFRIPTNGTVLVAREHESNEVLARTDDGTLSLSCDNFGLRFVANLSRPLGINRDFCGCSPKWSTIRKHEKDGIVVVDEAELEHICVACSSPAWDKNTAVWSDVRDWIYWPPHIRRLEYQFRSSASKPLAHCRTRAITDKRPLPVASAGTDMAIYGLPSFYKQILGGGRPDLSKIPAGARIWLAR